MTTTICPVSGGARILVKSVIVNLAGIIAKGALILSSHIACVRNLVVVYSLVLNTSSAGVRPLPRTGPLSGSALRTLVGPPLFSGGKPD